MNQGTGSAPGHPRPRGRLRALRAWLRAPLEATWSVAWFVVVTGGGFMGAFVGVVYLVNLLSREVPDPPLWLVLLVVASVVAAPMCVPILVVPTLHNLARRLALRLFGLLLTRTRLSARPWPRKAPHPLEVEGLRSDGVEVQLSVESTPLGAGRNKSYEGWGRLSWSARAAGPVVGGFTAQRAGLLAALRGAGPLDIRARGGDRREQGVAVEQVLERLLVDLGYEEVSVSGSAVSAGKARSTVFDLHPLRLREVSGLIAELLRLCAGRTVALAGVTVKGRVWTGGAEGARCPYCHDEVDLSAAGDQAPTACEGCGTVHHAACLTEAGGCTIFGCGRRRRARVAADGKA